MEGIKEKSDISIEEMIGKRVMENIHLLKESPTRSRSCGSYIRVVYMLSVYGRSPVAE